MMKAYLKVMNQRPILMTGKLKEELKRTLKKDFTLPLTLNKRKNQLFLK
jgi:hypothetical protein